MEDSNAQETIKESQESLNSSGSDSSSSEEIEEFQKNKLGDSNNQNDTEELKETVSSPTKSAKMGLGGLNLKVGDGEEEEEVKLYK